MCYEITRALETVYATAAARTPAAAEGGPRAGALETVYATAGALETVYATAAAPTKLKANVLMIYNFFELNLHQFMPILADFPPVLVAFLRMFWQCWCSVLRMCRSGGFNLMIYIFLN